MKIKDIGEFALIDSIKKLVPTGKDTVVGIGDDASVLKSSKSGMYNLFTTDILVEGRHFDLSRATPYQLGWKALGCSLSDIAAMGGIPRAAVVSIGVSGETDVDFCREIYRGMSELARRLKCGIVGGDTVGSEGGLVVSVAVLGEVEQKRLVLRSGAEPGDDVWVTGILGGSLNGKHLNFMPRVEEARFIVEHLPVKAMIDLSDGLANDLHRLASASRVGFRIDSARIPLDREAIGEMDEEKSVNRALYDGEDFELLLVLRQSRSVDESIKKFSSRFDCGISMIGKVVEESRGVTIAKGEKEKLLEEGGFLHFD